MELDTGTWRRQPVIRLLVLITVWTWRWSSDRIGLRPLLGRVTSHAAVGLTLGLLIVISNFQWNTTTVASEAVDMTLQQNTAMSAATVLTTSSPRFYYRTAQARIVRQAQPHTAVPERPRLELLTYTVQAGDTAEKIAGMFGIQPTTLMWSNPEMEKAPDLLRIGQVLTILPLDGVYHTVEEGDSLASLAEKYKVSVTDIINCEFNALTLDSILTSGQQIIVPGGTKPYKTREVTTYEGPVPEEVTGSGLFYWPASGVLTQGYWYGHRAIDIGGSEGSAIIASDAGYVNFAGWTDVGYGYLVVIDHANGYQTYYAHLSNIFVFEGDPVGAGQTIGAMGNTGNSTGPHLHYEIRYNGYPTNPLIYLP